MEQNIAFTFSLKKIGFAILAAALVFPAVAVSSGSIYAAEAAAISPPAASTPIITPQWEKAVAQPYAVQLDAAYAKGRVFYKAGVYLAAANVQTGKAQWTYKATPSSAPVTDANSVYYTDTAGQVHKVNQQTGKRTWMVTAPAAVKGSSYAPANLKIHNGLLLVGDSSGLTAYSSATGKVKWQTRTTGKNGYTVQSASGSIIIAGSAVTGTDGQMSLNGINAENGKRLWTLTGGYEGVLTIKGDYAFSRKYNNAAGSGHAVDIDKIALQTGQVTETFNYFPVEAAREGQASQVEYHKGYLYIVRKLEDANRSWGVQRMALEAPSESKPLNSYSFYSPLRRLDITDDSLIVGLVEKNMFLLNRETGKQQAKLQFTTSFFNETLDAGTHLIVQAAGKIYALKKP